MGNVLVADLGRQPGGRPCGSTLAPTSVSRMRATILPPPGLEIDAVAGIALSSDVTRLVYRAGNTLWVRASDELAARELPGSGANSGARCSNREPRNGAHVSTTLSDPHLRYWLAPGTPPTPDLKKNGSK